MIAIERAERILRIISQAWGPTDNTGYCFFPWIEGINRSFRTKAFRWPEQRDDILAHMVRHSDDDLYWCPVIFDQPQRRVEFAHEEYALWADLDEADPRKIDERWRPSVAWETSPGRYQALWLLEDPDEEDLYGASQRGADNQRMTVMVDADPSGWDTTQLLRLPGWTNHKPQYEVDGEFPQGKLLWNAKGPRYTGQDFNDLPEVPDETEDYVIDVDLAEKIDAIDAGEVMDRVGSLIPQASLDRMNRGPQDGEDRSGPLFYFMRCFADVGCSIQEIIAVVRSTKWNKFKGRPDEVEALTAQAQKAIAKRKATPSEEVDYEGVRINDFIAQVKRPTWLIKDMLVKGSVGFIAGDPKARKSWVALDLALSVAGSAATHTMDFLGQFTVGVPGPVLYFVLEDGDHLIKTRALQIWREKTKHSSAKLIIEDGVVYSVPHARELDVPLVVVHQQKMNLADQNFITLLQKRIRRGSKNDDGTYTPFALVIIDTLMRGMGTADINSMGEMTNTVLDPLTRIAKRSGTSLLLVHHFNKGQREGESRGGTRLLGSQALHAWAEDSLYLTAGEHGFGLELESKTAPSERWQFNTDPTQRTWSPTLANDNTAPVKSLDFAAVEKPRQRNRDFNPRGKLKNPKVINALYRLGPGAHRCADIAREANMAASNAHTALNLAHSRGRVNKEGRMWRLAE